MISIRKHPLWLPPSRTCTSSSGSKIRRALGLRLGPGHACTFRSGWSAWRTARCRPERASVVFLEDVLNRADGGDAVKSSREKGVGYGRAFEETASRVSRWRPRRMMSTSFRRTGSRTMCCPGTKCWTSTARPALMYRHLCQSSQHSPQCRGRNGKQSQERRTTDASYLTGESAYTLTKLIYKLPEVVIDAGERYEPSIVTRHIVDIAQAFNRFYHDEHILVDDEAERSAKLALVIAAKTAIKTDWRCWGWKRRNGCSEASDLYAAARAARRRWRRKLRHNFPDCARK